MNEKPANLQTLEGQMRDLARRVEHIEEAFPSGDYDGHRRAHEAFIERTAEIRRLRQAIIEKTISGLIWAAVVGLGVAAWKSFLAYIKTT